MSVVKISEMVFNDYHKLEVCLILKLVCDMYAPNVKYMRIRSKGRNLRL